MALALAGPPWWALGLVAHAAAAWLAGRALGDGRRDARFLATALVLSLPGLGLIGLSAIRFWRKRAAPAGMYAGAHSEMAGLPGPGQTPEPVDRVLDWLQAQVSVQPVADLIRAADPRTQRWGVGLLAKRGDGAAVELLREALGADDRDTQIAASGALQRVEERLVARIALSPIRPRPGSESTSAVARNRASRRPSPSPRPASHAAAACAMRAGGHHGGPASATATAIASASQATGSAAIRTSLPRGARGPRGRGPRTRDPASRRRRGRSGSWRSRARGAPPPPRHLRVGSPGG